MLTKIVYFKVCFCQIWANFIKFLILTIFCNGNLAFIWPFFIFQDLAFLKLLMARFGLFNFLDLATLVEKHWSKYVRRTLWYEIFFRISIYHGSRYSQCVSFVSRVRLKQVGGNECAALQTLTEKVRGIWGQFHQHFMCSFYAPKSVKNTVKSYGVFFTLLGSSSVKAVGRTWMKLSPGVNFINISRAAFTCIDPKSSKTCQWNRAQGSISSNHSRAAFTCSNTLAFNNNMPNFTSTLNYKLRPTLMMYTLPML